MAKRVDWDLLVLEGRTDVTAQPGADVYEVALVYIGDEHWEQRPRVG